MPKASSSTLASTARQFVVHEALETTKSRPGSNESSLTPTTKVASASLAGAEMITRRRARLDMGGRLLPAGQPAGALDHDVDPELLPRQLAGVGLHEHGDRRRSPPSWCRAQRRPAPGSARGPSPAPASGRAQSGSPRSFTAATSTSWGDLMAARRKARPVRPNPLIATLTAIVDASIAHRDHTAPSNLDGPIGLGSAVVPKVPDPAFSGAAPGRTCTSTPSSEARRARRPSRYAGLSVAAISELRSPKAPWRRSPRSVTCSSAQFDLHDVLLP